LHIGSPVDAEFRIPRILRRVGRPVHATRRLREISAFRERHLDDLRAFLAISVGTVPMFHIASITLFH
jgi:hypothetical protein